MDTNNFRLLFDGYWNESQFQHIPTYKGLYIVQAANYNKDELFMRSLRPIYIENSNNIRKSVTNHSNLLLWKSALKPNEQLFFSSVLILDCKVLARLKDVLIYANNPVFGSVKQSHWILEPIEIQCAGMYYALKKYVSISKEKVNY